MRGLEALLTSLSADAGRRGREFERLCQWFLRNDPVYGHELAKVWRWDEWPGRWGADAGIDLVAEDRTGGLWAIQCKVYDPRYTVTKKDVDSFLSESARSVFTFRLLIATTDRIGRTAQRTIEGQEKRAALLLASDLARAQVDWPRSLTDLRPRPRRPKRPRPHQREAIRAVVKGFDRSHRGQMIMACGTGKTLAALFVAEKLAAQRTLVLVPSLSLLAQTLREWTANATDDFDFLPVCSDETGPTKTHERRTVPLPAFLADELARHIAPRAQEPGALVFTTPEGEQIRHNNFYNRRFRPAVAASGVPAATRFHDLRHTCASLLIAQGAHPKAIAELLGHSTITVTLDRYGHLFEGLAEQLAIGLDETYRAAQVPSQAVLHSVG